MVELVEVPLMSDGTVIPFVLSDADVKHIMGVKDKPGQTDITLRQDDEIKHIRVRMSYDETCKLFGVRRYVWPKVEKKEA